MNIKKEDDEPRVARRKKVKKFTEEQLKVRSDLEAKKIRKKHNINIKGGVDTAPIESFTELFEKYNIDPRIVENVTKNYQLPTIIQMQAIPIMLEGRQIKACAATGSGKTLAFLLPLIQGIINEPKSENTIKSIILVPTRELATQILGEAVRMSIKTEVRSHIITNTNDKSMKDFWKKKTNILICTPNRLSYFIKNSPEKFSLSAVKWIVIDEVDKLFEESRNSFQEDLDIILKACSNPDKKFALFSATTTPVIAKWTIENVKNYATVNIAANSTINADKVIQELKFVGGESGKIIAFREIINNGISPPVLIFVQSKDRAQQLYQELAYDGINVDLIHSDRTQSERDIVVKKFREGKIWFLICTELMSRGIDFKDVNLVINFDFPQSQISYIHRVGRTGRAGKTGKAITFFTSDDKKYLRDIATIIKRSGGNIEQYMLSLKKSRKKDRMEIMKKAPKRKMISQMPQLGEKERKKIKFARKQKAKTAKMQQD